MTAANYEAHKTIKC